MKKKTKKKKRPSLKTRIKSEVDVFANAASDVPMELLNVDFTEVDNDKLSDALSDLETLYSEFSCSAGVALDAVCKAARINSRPYWFHDYSV